MGSAGMLMVNAGGPMVVSIFVLSAFHQPRELIPVAYQIALLKPRVSGCGLARLAATEQTAGILVDVLVPLMPVLAGSANLVSWRKQARHPLRQKPLLVVLFRCWWSTC